jgi:hypothetical protein
VLYNGTVFCISFFFFYASILDIGFDNLSFVDVADEGILFL